MIAKNKRLVFKRLASGLTTRCLWLLAMLWLLVSPAMAQGKRPSQVLRDLTGREEKLRERFEQQVRRGEAQTFEWEARREEIIAEADRALAGLTAPQGKSAELLALAAICEMAERYPEAAGIYREVRQLNPGELRVEGVDVDASLISVLIENDQLDEAGALIDRDFSVRMRDLLIPIARLELFKALAFALRDRQLLERSAQRAWTGFNLAEQLLRMRRIDESVRETVQRTQLSLAALHLSLVERLNRQTEARRMRQMMQLYNFTDNPPAKIFYEEELRRARLIGRQAAELSGVEWIGSPLPLTQWAGRVVILDFWSMWCQPCQAAFPTWRQLLARHGERDLRLLGVTRWYGRSDRLEDLSPAEERREMTEYIAKHRLGYPIAIAKMDDIANEERYEVAGFPTVVVVDRKGVIRYIRRGIGDYRRFNRLIGRLLAEKQI